MRLWNKRLTIPRTLVALLNPIKLKAEIPCGVLAKAHLTASKALIANSPRRKIVNCDKTFSRRIVRSGFENIND